MQAELFYTQHAKHAIPLFVVSQRQWEQGLQGLTSAERACFSVHQFTGSLGDCCWVSNADGLVDKIFIGSGAGTQEQALASAALLVPPGTYVLQEPLTEAAAIGWGLAQYRYSTYKKKEVPARVLDVQDAALADILAMTQAVYLVRDLINQPANDLDPTALAEVVAQLARAHGAVFEEWVGDALLQDNFPAIHAVGRAAYAAPRLLSLTWGNVTHPRVTLVGKGVCFDSGGLDIKPSTAMRYMKKDMGGAAHAIGLAQWIMTQKIPIRLQVLIPAVENAIGPDAFRPGDVLTMRNGLTVEIDNTDAEGRLVLADALVKACEDTPDLLIDFATLTGAARVAVGTEIAAMFSNKDVVAEAIASAASGASDPVWRLPLFSAYEELLNSSIADMVNASASPYAGAIVAALFLQRFVAPSIPWVHFDVMAWNVSSKPGKPEGGEAMGVRAIAAYLAQTYPS